MSKILDMLFPRRVQRRREAAARILFLRGDLAEANGCPIAAARYWLRGANTLRGDYEL